MKSNMQGAIKEYTKMFKLIMDWGEPMGKHNNLYAHGTHSVLGNEDSNYIFDVGFMMNELGWHWSDEESRDSERDVAKRISTAYYCLVKALAEAIDYDYEKYDPESSMYEYHLKNLDIDKILKWRGSED